MANYKPIRVSRVCVLDSLKIYFDESYENIGGKYDGEGNDSVIY